VVSDAAVGGGTGALWAGAGAAGEAPELVPARFGREPGLALWEHFVAAFRLASPRAGACLLVELAGGHGGVVGLGVDDEVAAGVVVAVGAEVTAAGVVTVAVGAGVTAAGVVTVAVGAGVTAAGVVAVPAVVVVVVPSVPLVPLVVVVVVVSVGAGDAGVVVVVVTVGALAGGVVDVPSLVVDVPGAAGPVAAARGGGALAGCALRAAVPPVIPPFRALDTASVLTISDSRGRQLTRPPCVRSLQCMEGTVRGAPERRP
jgi:hypothetical protein